MANWLWFSKWHTRVFHLTGGRIGASLAGVDMVLVDTIGHKSGLLRTTPIACYPYQGDVVVSASNNGQDMDPAWWINMKAHPEIEIQLGTRRYKAHAEEITGAEREALWQIIIKLNPPQAHHQKKTTRLIPLVRLRKVSLINK